MDRFFYIISDQQNQVLVLKSYNFPTKTNYVQYKSALQSTLIDDQLLRWSYKGTKISLVGNVSALVPKELFFEDQKNLYLEHLVQADLFNTVQHDYISELEIHNVFSFNSEIHSLLNTYFPRADFYHFGTCLLKSIKGLMQHQTGNMVYINVLQSIFQIVVFNDGQLQFYNTFKYKSTKDFLYFVMLVYDQLNLNQEKVSMNISGELMEDSDIYKLIYKYTRNIHFIKRPNYYRFSEKFQTIPEHFYFDLYSLKLCG